MADATQLHPMAVLRRELDGHFSLVVRWLLGTGEALPLDDDRFEIRCRLQESDRYLGNDGIFGAPGDYRTLVVRPRLFVMIDPPRLVEELGTSPAGEPTYWARAREPAAPVDPAHAHNGTLRYGDELQHSHAMGVIHLLQESTRSRQAWRIANAFAPFVRRHLNDVRNTTNGLQILGPDVSSAAQESSRQLARYLVENDIRPLDLPKILNRANSRLVAAIQLGALRSPDDFELPGIFRLHTVGSADMRFATNVAHGALITLALNSEEVIERLDVESSSRSQTRQQLRLRALQGGHLIDFWCDPDNPTEKCVDTARGQTYPASELIGTGITTGQFSPDEIKDWIKADETLQVSVDHHAGSGTNRVDRPLTESVIDSPGDIVEADPRPARWQAGSAPPIRAAIELRLAVSFGSTVPPPPPKSAEINYDLTQSNAGDVGEPDRPVEKSLTYETGEGKIQLLIVPPPQRDGRKSVFSYNVYGFWEGAPGTEPYFADPSLNPSLEHLKPWLITRRYSLTRDLWPAFRGSPGSVHPTVKRVLADPPWFPVFERPDKVFDPTDPPDPDSLADASTKESERGRPLPVVGRDGMTAWSLDLRKGMRAPDDLPEGIQIGWDPFGALDVEWTPEKDRAGNELRCRPQRYRFWVTSVDAFEQESAPVAVRANDEQAGEPESFIYEPRWRAPLLPPPRGTQAFAQGEESLFSLTFDEAARSLKAVWETPYQNNVAGQVGGRQMPKRMDRDSLRAHIVIFRKRLLQEPSVPEGQLEARMPTNGIFDLPQWAQLISEISERGFHEFHREIDIYPPPDDVWSYRHTIEWTNRGFEYVVAVGYSISAADAPFWSKNVIPGVNDSGRRAIVYEAEDGDFRPVVHWIADTPRFSDIAVTDPVRIINDAEPRGVELLTPDLPIIPARPVLPPPRVGRDLILLRLLSHEFVRGGNPEPRRSWSDTDIELTAGQIAMCETAIRRAVDRAGTQPNIVHQPRYRVLRRMLAEEFDARSNQPVLRQHSTIGFRGIKTLRWRYKPFNAVAPQTDHESEAVLTRVYAVRAPIETAEARSYASFTATGERVDGPLIRYRLHAALQDGVERFLAIAEIGQPALVRIADAENTDKAPVFALLTNIEDALGNNQLLTVQPIDTAKVPKQANLLGFAGQPVVDVPIQDFDAASSYALDVPIGGGYPEIFCWWLASVSAQGREARPGRRVAITTLVPMTIEPDPPAAVEVSPPTDKVGHVLNPTMPHHRAFLPSVIASLSHARNNPRLLLSWEDPRESVKANIVIHRQRKRIVEDDYSVAELLSSARSPWKAIKAVEAAGADDFLDTADLELLERTWLLGNVVEPDGEDGSSTDDMLIAPSRGLSSTEGLLLVERKGSGRTRKAPAFIDYYFANHEQYFAMDANWLYRYRLARTIDLDPQNQLGLAPERRYLTSRPTNWTPYYLPETPPFRIELAGYTADPDPSLVEPIIELRFMVFSSPAHVSVEALSDPSVIKEWLYRIIVRRRVDIPFAVSGDSPGHTWVDIGSPKDVHAGADPAIIVDDLVDRSFPEETKELVYDFVVMQYAVHAIDGVVTERLVRGRTAGTDGVGEPFKIVLPAMARNGSNLVERYVRQTVNII